MRVGIGFSQVKDVAAAGRQAAEEALRRSGEAALTLLFCAGDYAREEALRAVKEVVGSSKLVGAGVFGLIVGARVFTEGLAVCTLGGPYLKAATCLEKDISRYPYESGERAGKKLLQSGIDSGVLLAFPDALAGNISLLLKGLYQALGPNFCYLGAGAGDNLRASKSFQFTEEGISRGSLAIAALKGVSFAVGQGHGLKPKGELLLVTKADGKRVFELDGLPAYERYASCAGGIPKRSFASFALRYPLGFAGPEGSFLLRDPLAVHKDGSITFVADVPQNTVATIMETDTDGLLSAAGEASLQAAGKCPAPKIVLLFDCVSRYLLSPKGFTAELTAITKNFPGDLPVLGMLSFGEVGSISGVPLFYNKTVIVAAGGDAD